MDITALTLGMAFCGWILALINKGEMKTFKTFMVGYSVASTLVFLLSLLA